MMLHQLRATQSFKADAAEVWDFLSSPLNLSRITPEYMKFQVLSPPSPIYQGQIIEYHVRPLLGIRLHWVTEITQVQEGVYFVDEQRFGPYAFWHHQHFIRAVAGGTEMTDIVHYKLPLGIAGRALNSLLVQRQLQDIFHYRRRQLATIWDAL